MRTWAPRKDKARTSGLLLHAFGADGASPLNQPHSFRVVIQEGGTGDLVMVSRGKTQSLTVETAEVKISQGNKARPFCDYKPKAPPNTLTTGVVHRLGNEPNRKDEVGFRSTHELEKPHGEWN